MWLAPALRIEVVEADLAEMTAEADLAAEKGMAAVEVDMPAVRVLTAGAEPVVEATGR